MRRRIKDEVQQPPGPSEKPRKCVPKVHKATYGRACLLVESTL